jgi:hypothetical protein
MWGLGGERRRYPQHSGIIYLQNMAKRRKPAPKHVPQPPPKPVKLPLFSKAKALWKKLRYVAVVGTIATLLFRYVSTRPAIEFVRGQLGEPVAPGVPILVDGTVKNFGDTTARNYRMRAVMATGLTTERGKPDLNQKKDWQGNAVDPSTIQLAPGQENHFATSSLAWRIGHDEYSRFTQGKQKILFHAQFQYQDLLFIPHTKVICFKLVPFSRIMVRCTPQDSDLP